MAKNDVYNSNFGAGTFDSLTRSHGRTGEDTDYSDDSTGTAIPQVTFYGHAVPPITDQPDTSAPMLTDADALITDSPAGPDGYIGIDLVAPADAVNEYLWYFEFNERLYGYNDSANWAVGGAAGTGASSGSALLFDEVVEWATPADPGVTAWHYRLKLIPSVSSTPLQEGEVEITINPEGDPGHVNYDPLNDNLIRDQYGNNVQFQMLKWFVDRTRPLITVVLPDVATPLLPIINWGNQSAAFFDVIFNEDIPVNPGTGESWARDPGLYLLELFDGSSNLISSVTAVSVSELSKASYSYADDGDYTARVVFSWPSSSELDQAGEVKLHIVDNYDVIKDRALNAMEASTTSFSWGIDTAAPNWSVFDPACITAGWPVEIPAYGFDGPLWVDVTFTEELMNGEVPPTGAPFLPANWEVLGVEGAVSVASVELLTGGSAPVYRVHLQTTASLVSSIGPMTLGVISASASAQLGIDAVKDLSGNPVVGTAMSFALSKPDGGVGGPGGGEFPVISSTFPASMPANGTWNQELEVYFSSNMRAMDPAARLAVWDVTIDPASGASVVQVDEIIVNGNKVTGHKILFSGTSSSWSGFIQVQPQPFLGYDQNTHRPLGLRHSGANSQLIDTCYGAGGRPLSDDATTWVDPHLTVRSFELIEVDSTGPQLINIVPSPGTQPGSLLAQGIQFHFNEPIDLGAGGTSVSLSGSLGSTSWDGTPVVGSGGTAHILTVNFANWAVVEDTDFTLVLTGVKDNFGNDQDPNSISVTWHTADETGPVIINGGYPGTLDFNNGNQPTVAFWFSEELTTSALDPANWTFSELDSGANFVGWSGDWSVKLVPIVGTSPEWIDAPNNSKVDLTLELVDGSDNPVDPSGDFLSHGFAIIPSSNIVDLSGNGYVAGHYSFMPLAPPVAPDAPILTASATTPAAGETSAYIDVTVNHPGTGAVALTFTTEYSLDGSSWFGLQTSAAWGQTTTHTGFVWDTLHYIRAKAEIPGAPASPWTSSVTTTTGSEPVQPPSVPTGLSCTTVGWHQIDVTVDDTPTGGAVALYHLFVSYDAGSTWESINAPGSSVGGGLLGGFDTTGFPRTFNVIGHGVGGNPPTVPLDAAQTYHFKLEAMNAGGVAATDGQDNCQTNAYLPPPTPEVWIVSEEQWQFQIGQGMSESDFFQDPDGGEAIMRAPLHDGNGNQSNPGTYTFVHPSSPGGQMRVAVRAATSPTTDDALMVHLEFKTPGSEHINNPGAGQGWVPGGTFTLDGSQQAIGLFPNAVVVAGWPGTEGETTYGAYAADDEIHSWFVPMAFDATYLFRVRSEHVASAAAGGSQFSGWAFWNNAADGGGVNQTGSLEMLPAPLPSHPAGGAPVLAPNLPSYPGDWVVTWDPNAGVGPTVPSGFRVTIHKTSDDSIVTSGSAGQGSASWAPGFGVWDVSHYAIVEPKNDAGVHHYSDAALHVDYANLLAAGVGGKSDGLTLTQGGGADIAVTSTGVDNVQACFDTSWGYGVQINYDSIVESANNHWGSSGSGAGWADNGFDHAQFYTVEYSHDYDPFSNSGTWSTLPSSEWAVSGISNQVHMLMLTSVGAAGASLGVGPVAEFVRFRIHNTYDGDVRHLGMSFSPSQTVGLNDGPPDIVYFCIDHQGPYPNEVGDGSNAGLAMVWTGSTDGDLDSINLSWAQGYVGSGGDTSNAGQVFLGSFPKASSWNAGDKFSMYISMGPWQGGWSGSGTGVAPDFMPVDSQTALTVDMFIEDAGNPGTWIPVGQTSAGGNWDVNAYAEVIALTNDPSRGSVLRVIVHHNDWEQGIYGPPEDVGETQGNGGISVPFTLVVRDVKDMSIGGTPSGNKQDVHIHGVRWHFASQWENTIGGPPNTPAAILLGDDGTIVFNTSSSYRGLTGYNWGSYTPANDMHLTGGGWVEVVNTPGAKIWEFLGMDSNGRPFKVTYMDQDPHYRDVVSGQIAFGA